LKYDEYLKLSNSEIVTIIQSYLDSKGVEYINIEIDSTTCNGTHNADSFNIYFTMYNSAHEVGKFLKTSYIYEINTKECEYIKYSLEITDNWF